MSRADVILQAAIAIALTALMYVLSKPAAAIDIAWYEQRAPGDASGEMRFEGLGEGDLDIDTPGRRMEIGVLRTGDVAIVTLTEPAGTSARVDDASRELIVVASQGTDSVRAIYQLAMPAPVEPDPPAAVVQPSPISAAPAVPVVEEPDASADIVPPAEHSSVRQAPVLASLDPGPSKPSLQAVCPVLAIRPGSLRSNVSRMLGECGARMGEWITGGAEGEYLTDWIVREPRILAERNGEGLQGLLELLYAHYRLQGLPSADTAAIDIYKTE